MPTGIELQKNNIYTLVGRFINSENKFITLEGIEYDCMSYKCNKEITNPDILCAVNIVWRGEGIQSWVISQYCILDNDVSVASE